MSFVVTIDGPAAAGKSTTARAVARRLGFLYLDTGALYRGFALKALEHGVAPEDTPHIEQLMADTTLGLAGDPEHPQVWVDGAEVGERIRTPEVSGCPPSTTTASPRRIAAVCPRRNSRSTARPPHGTQPR